MEYAEPDYTELVNQANYGVDIHDDQPSSNFISPIFRNNKGAGFKTNCDLGTLTATTGMIT
jgi:hypothetical protein